MVNFTEVDKIVKQLLALLNDDDETISYKIEIKKENVGVWYVGENE